MNLGDPRWEGVGVIIGAIIGVLSILVPILIWWFFQQNRKSLSYSYLVTSLVNSPNSNGQLLQTLYNGNQVDQPGLIIIRFRNSGNVEIRKQDFEKAVTITIKEGTALEASIIEKSPDSLDPKVSLHPLDGTSIEVKPLLLNKGDEFSLRILVDGSKPSLSVIGRIAGIKNLELVKIYDEREYSRFRLRIYPMVVGTGILGGGVISLYYNLQWLNMLSFFESILLVLLGLILYFPTSIWILRFVRTRLS